MTSLDLTSPLIFGFGVTGQGVANALVARGYSPTLFDDRVTPKGVEAAGRLGLELRDGTDRGELAAMVEKASLLIPSPGLPSAHPLFDFASQSGCPICTEFDLARAWDDRPFVSITGTNGKTSVTMMVTDALECSGIKAAAVGNTEIPFVVAIDDPTTEVFVVEASSFRLAHTQEFSPSVATWLNFAPDHLDVHSDLAEYEQAKAAVWSGLGPDGVAVANLDDPVVMSHAPGNVVTFGLSHGDWRIENDSLVGPTGPVLEVSELARRQPHDLLNAAAVAATATHAGAEVEGLAQALRNFAGLPHRVEFVGEWNGVRWFNDSKATVPQATLAAVGGFDSVILIAGGRNKGLDLSPLKEALGSVKAVIGIGEAGPEVAAVTSDSTPTQVVQSMQEAVDTAATLSEPHDVVLLSPACTSFDWYGSYGERGSDFIRLTRERLS